MLSIHRVRNTNVGGGRVDVRSSDGLGDLFSNGHEGIKTKFLSHKSVRKDKSCHKQRGSSERCLSLKRPQSTPIPNQQVKFELVLPSTSYTGPSTTMRPSTVDADTLIGHSLKLQDWLNEKQVKSVQEKADLEARNTRKLYTDVLETESTFVKDLGDMLDHKDMLELRKREMLHKKWTENVYEPIRRQVDGQMRGPGYHEVARRKRQLHKEYLEHVNKKGHVFLDTIAPDEYYAMSLHPTRPSLLTAYTRGLKDPLLNQERARAEEDRVIYQCEMGSALNDRELRVIRLPQLPLVPLGRHGTECRTWLEMPMGDIESPVRMASRHRFKPTSNESQIDFPRWAKLQFATGQVEEEVKIEKKRMYSQDLPNDRTLSHPALTHNCGGPAIPPTPRRGRGLPVHLYSAALNEPSHQEAVF